MRYIKNIGTHLEVGNILHFYGDNSFYVVIKIGESYGVELLSLQNGHRIKMELDHPLQYTCKCYSNINDMMTNLFASLDEASPHFCLKA